MLRRNRSLWFALLTAVALFLGCAPPAEKETEDADSNSTGAASADVDSPATASAEAASAEVEAASQVSDTNVTAPETVVTLKPVSVMLGDPSLTAGINGSAAPSIEQIKAWLDKPENHAVIEPELPFGLAAAKANIKGVKENPLTRAKIELGRQLYFDTRLSSDNTISCASCHSPTEGFGRRMQFGEGVRGQLGGRNSPVSYNRIVSGPQFWDGRAESLEAQAVGPIANPIEMGNTHEAAVKTVKGIQGYVMQFEKIFDDGVTIDNVGKAIATFERTIITGPAPYDYNEYVRTIDKQYGEDIDELKEEDPEVYAVYEKALEGSKAMTESAQRGRDLFFSEKVGCTACHAGANFTDELYHNLGVGMDADQPDLGRYEVTKLEKDKGAFKTPTCRNVALSAPYMHDGSQKTLEEVVQWYSKGGHPNPYLSDKVKKLNLSDQDVKDLVEFMSVGLTSDFPKIEVAGLPE